MKHFINRVSIIAFIGMLLSLHVHAEIEKITLTTINGDKFSAYSAGPENAKAGIVLVHDWFGDSDFFQQSAQRLAKLGYRVIAVDYYNGESATTHEDAWELLSKLDKTLAVQKIEAAFDTLAKTQKQIASLSFSAGTELAYQAGLGRNDITAQALWYGYMPNKNEGKKAIPATLVVIGSNDGDAAKNGEQYSAFMDANKSHGEFYLYPLAHHAFAQPLFNQGKTYDKKATSAAWAITENFFSRAFK